jgi:prepilin-type N-terminal cleavage/methylation domain-containing protein
MKRRGFTLVEVLVTVGIIVALAGLIFGVLGPAREKGRQAVCASNMRQLGMVMMMYASDWGGTEPVQGVPMEYWQVGFPANYHAILSKKEVTAGLITCPSQTFEFHPGFSFMYTLPPCKLREEADGPRYLAQMGTRFPLVVCICHNDGKSYYEPDGLPDWYQFRIRVLRYDQSLSWRTLPARPFVKPYLY